MHTRRTRALLGGGAVVMVLGCNGVLGIEPAHLWTGGSAGTQPSFGGSGNASLAGSAGEGQTGAVSAGGAESGGSGLGGAAMGGVSARGGNNSGGISAQGGSIAGGQAGSGVSGGQTGLSGGATGTAGSSGAAGNPAQGGTAGGSTPSGGLPGDAGTAGSSGLGGSGGSSAGGSSAGAGGAEGGGGQSGSCSSDLTTDAANCGSCGHSCLSGACIASRCQPFQLYAHSGAGGDDLALLPSSPPRLLASIYDLVDIELSAGYPWVAYSPAAFGFGEIGVAGTAYFAGATNGTSSGTLYYGSAADLDSVSPTGPAVWTTPALPRAVVADNDYVYWAECTSSTSAMILRRPRSGASPSNTPVAYDLTDCPTRMLLDGNRLWFTAIDGNGVFNVEPTLSVSNPSVWKGVGSTRGLAVDQDYVYWTTWNIVDQDTKSATGSICRAKKDGTNTVCFGTPQTGPIALQLDGGWLYFASEGSTPSSGIPFADGAINRMPADLSTVPEPLARDQERPRNLVLTADAVYWVNMGTAEIGNGSVWGVAK